MKIKFTSMPYHRVMEKVFNTPLMATRTKLSAVLTVLGDRSGVPVALEGGEELAAPNDDSERQPRYYSIQNKHAIIPVQGSLVNNLGEMTPYSGMTGYDGISKNLHMAVADDAVESIVLDIDSHGGEAAGAMELGREVRALSKIKPILAMVNSSAYSAAYAIASGASKIVMSSSGGVGSVGVIAAHFDRSKALENEGIKATLVYAGKRKADFTDVAPLTKDALERLQSSVNGMYDDFTAMVAEHRGMTQEEVKATEALTYQGSDAVEIGFADEIRNFTAGASLASAEHAELFNEIVIKEANEMPWTTLCETLRLEVRDSDEENEAQIVGLVEHLREKADTSDELTSFLNEHDVDSLSELAEHMESMCTRDELEDAQSELLNVRAEQTIDSLMTEGKVTEAQRDSALNAYLNDKDSFLSLMENAAPVVPTAAVPEVAPKAGAPSASAISKEQKAAMKADGYSDDEIAAAEAALKSEK